jgi:signal transduction histidine kinase/CheY-like chemotaxis protein
VCISTGSSLSIAPTMQNSAARPPKQLPLRWFLILPFLLQIFAAVGLVGYLSYKNGQKAVTSLATQLMNETNNRVDQHLDYYLATPHQLNQINIDALEMGGLDVQDGQTSGRYFWKQLQVFKNVSFVGYVLNDGRYGGAGRWIEGQGVTIDEQSPGSNQGRTYATDRQGNRTKLVLDEPYFPLTEPWYTETIKAGKPIWSQIYTTEGNSDESEEYVAASANRPIYDKAGKVIGVIGTDLLLSNISDFLRGLKVSKTGRIFIVERDGLLVGDSSGQKPYATSNDETRRLNVLSSKDPLIRSTAQALQQGISFEQMQQTQARVLELEGDRHFVQITPWQDQYGLDWLVVVVVPESDFMGQINANTRTTIWLCLGALGIAALLGIATASWIARPIRRLSLASEAIANGNLHQKVQIQGVKELSSLAQSFNQMAIQLRESFAALATSNAALERNNQSLESTNSSLGLSNEELEQRVQERTVELQTAKEIADKANQAKSYFLANMSHDLRTPLNGILGYAQVLQRDKNATPKQKDGLNVIYQCGTHLSTLINDILDLAKVEAGKLELAPHNFQLEKMLQGIRDLCRIQAEQKNIGFKLQILNQLPAVVYGDEKRLRQVLINLLGNAIKFTDHGEVKLKVGRMLVSERPLSRYDKGVVEPGKQTVHSLRFQIEDTGMGMTPEQMEAIFQPFEQVGEISRQAEGTGLGLSISRTLITMMGSEIKVKSDLGEGSLFWFTLDLPIVSDWSEPTDSIDRIITGYEGAPRTILLVDDRWENRAVVLDLLKPLGFNLVEAEEGQDGLSKAKEHQLDLIITDLAMPVMDGLEMTRSLREWDEFKDIPIIASSAFVFNYDRQQSQEAGCDDFLPKPVQATELFDLLQRHLNLIWLYE